MAEWRERDALDAGRPGIRLSDDDYNVDDDDFDNHHVDFDNHDVDFDFDDVDDGRADDDDNGTNDNDQRVDDVDDRCAEHDRRTHECVELVIDVDDGADHELDGARKRVDRAVAYQYDHRSAAEHVAQDRRVEWLARNGWTRRDPRRPGLVHVPIASSVARDAAQAMKITASPGRVYVLSPPDIHERAVRAAAELILLDFTRETIEYELGQKFGMTRPQALRAVHEAFARVPLRLHHPRV